MKSANRLKLNKNWKQGRRDTLGVRETPLSAPTSSGLCCGTGNKKQIPDLRMSCVRREKAFGFNECIDEAAASSTHF